MDDVTSKTSGVSGWGPGGRGCGQGGSATVWGAVGWGVQAVQWSEPQGGLGLVREESPACSWGWGLGTESAQLGWYQGWGGGGACSSEASVQPAPLDPRTQGASRDHGPILPAPGKACFLLPMGCGHQRWGAQATSEVWGLSTGRTAVPPQGTETAGCPGRKVRRSQGRRAAPLPAPLTRAHLPRVSPCGLCGTPQSHQKGPSPAPGNHTLGQVGGRPPRGSPSLLGPSLLFHKLKKFLQAWLTRPPPPTPRSFPFFLFFINNG